MGMEEQSTRFIRNAAAQPAGAAARGGRRAGALGEHMAAGSRGFLGWYFKHQKGDDLLAFIPGRARSGAFVQMLTAEGSRQFDVPALSLDGGVIRAGDCAFSARGCRIRLPGVTGEIAYGPLTPLAGDIMGPFRFFPMECRHGVISMAHALGGSVRIDGTAHDFSGGSGYIEMDGGTSFPRSYLWLQCNDFPEPCSVMASVAAVPFCGVRFPGCIAAVLYRGREYRLATYRGVRILAAGPEHICLSQGKLLLEIDARPADGGHPLRSPLRGRMTGCIRESGNAAVRVRLFDRGRPVLDLCSGRAAYEFVPPETR